MEANEECAYTKQNNYAGSKIIRSLAIILAIFLWFDCQFLSSDGCFKQYKA